MSNVHQTLMDRAYDRWAKGWTGLSYGEFVNRLDFAERLAVLAGNLNYQVENGGFTQWCDNGYGEQAGLLHSTLSPYADRPGVGEVLRLVSRAAALFKESNGEEEWPKEFDELDTKYYAVKAVFLATVEAILSELTAAAEQKPAEPFTAHELDVFRSGMTLHAPKEGKPVPDDRWYGIYFAHVPRLLATIDQQAREIERLKANR